MAQMNSVAKARPRWGKFAAIFLPSSHYLIPIFGLKICSQNLIPELANCSCPKPQEFSPVLAVKIAHALFDSHFIESATCLLARTLPKKCDS